MVFQQNQHITTVFLVNGAVAQLDLTPGGYKGSQDKSLEPELREETEDNLTRFLASGCNFLISVTVQLSSGHSASSVESSKPPFPPVQPLCLSVRKMIGSFQGRQSASQKEWRKWTTLIPVLPCARFQDQLEP